jgi:hypothetical protein
MTCAEFQRALPEIIDTGGNKEQESHLSSCAVCTDLVQDLRYIAEQAKLLVPMEDPSPRVWDGIHNALEREGMVRPRRGTGRFRPATVLTPSRWSTIGVFAAIAAVLVIAIGLVSYRRSASPPADRESPQAAPTQAASVAGVQNASQASGDSDADDDAKLIAHIQKAAPALASTYDDNLKSVNSYIAAVRNQLRQNPNDEQARDYLVRAYDQKAMLYSMAMERTLQ